MRTIDQTLQPIPEMTRQDPNRHARPRRPRRTIYAASARAAACLLLALPVGGPPASAAPATAGPLVAVPYCKVVSEGCGLDPEAPDLSPAGCAATIADHLERRGVRAEAIGPGTVVCGEGSNALLLEATLTSQCPARARDKLLIDKVMSIRLLLEIEMNDCFSGEVLGKGTAERAIESGRHILVRDAVEELAHHTSEMRIRSLFPETPVRWMRGDIGGERSIELAVGGIDISGSGTNDFLDAVGIDNEDTASRILLEGAYNPMSSQHTRLGIGMEYISVSSDDKGNVDLAAVLELDPANHPGFDPNMPHRVKLDLGVIGLRGSVAQGFDFTKNQRISVQGAVGYYVLGTGLAPAAIEIDGLPESANEFHDVSLMLEGTLRYTWRFTSHIALSAAYGYTWLEFHTPNRVGRGPHFPFDFDFSGASARVGLAGRF
jgi:hypothetical protein